MKFSGFFQMTQVLALLLATGILWLPEKASAAEKSSGKVYGLAWSVPVASSTTNIPELLAPRWQHREYATPVFHPATGLVFIGSSDRSMRAYSLNQKLVWTYETGGSISSVPVVGKYLYFGADDGKLYALHPSSGKVAWSHTADAEVTGPARIKGDALYFSTSLDTVYCIDANSGEYRWHVRHSQPLGITLHGNAAPTLATALMEDGMDMPVLITGYSDGTMAVLDADNGLEIWTATIGKGEAFYDVDSDPVVIGPLVIAAANEGGISAFELATGKLVWHSKTNGMVRLGSDGKVVVAAGAENVVGLDPASGKLIWRFKYSKGSSSRPVFDSGRVLVNSDNGPLYVLDSASGEMLQAFGSPLGMSGDPAISDDLLLLFTNGGKLYALSSSFGGWAHRKK